MPENARRVFQYADENGDISTVVLQDWSRAAFLDVLDLPELSETGETPVTLFRDKAMVRICEKSVIRDHAG